jgi:hypothetical protein
MARTAFRYATKTQVVAAVTISCIAPSQVYAEPPSASQTPVDPNASSETAADAEIVIEGRHANDRYRLPSEFRTLRAERDHRSNSIDPRLACRAVGPTGCGFEPLPIVTFRSDGTMQIGASKEH